MRVRLFAPGYWLTWAGLGLLRVAALLPFPLMVAVGRALGAVLRRLPIGFVRTARRNLELCFPELSPQARERLLDRHFESLGIALLEIPLAWWLSPARLARSEEHTSELQSRLHLVCRLLLEKKKNTRSSTIQ